ncbi:metallophosphoesterase family protein [Solitalea koreensis]|uniref:Nuclease SbcCD subunit D n=1 Tax=Solitalea koreensis TaxID=543615 RepID=A0A521EK88_9SPHI|nr:exonuclease subunit SbcD [Solitalea koreensis]SMO84326.1 Exodeoxyribonuclease I subunit D [Solitalea koreensis]
MRVLHTADWHLGKRLDNFSRHTEQVEVMKEICEIAERENVDAVLIAGDLFDTFNPPTESVELFYKTIKRLSANGKRPVIAIAGNHDSPDRIEAPDPLARECGILFAGFPNSIIAPFKLESGLEVLKSAEGFIELKLPDQSTPLRLILTPYANEFRLKQFLGTENQEEELRSVLEKKWKTLADEHCNDQGVNMLMAHLYFAKRGEELPEEPEDEKSILSVGNAQVIYSDAIPEQIQYVALGHLHRKQRIDKHPCPIIYSSSPIAYSFGETNQQKYVLIIEAEAGKPVTIRETDIRQGKKLLRKSCKNVSEAVEWLSENTEALVELTMHTNTFLTGDERRQLNAAHPNIIGIIPIVNTDSIQERSTKQINLDQNIEELFKDYFQSKNGQHPNDELISLFKELL